VLAPQSLSAWFAALQGWFDNPELGLDDGEGFFFATRMFDFITSCDERRLGQWEGVPWWEYVDADNHSQAYQDLLARGLTRSLVAMRAEVASTRTIATILWQMMFLHRRCRWRGRRPRPQCAHDGCLAGAVVPVPARPWRHLLDGQQRRGITLGGGQVQSVQVLQGGAPVDVFADYFVFAVPQEVMAALVTPAIIGGRLLSPASPASTSTG